LWLTQFALFLLCCTLPWFAAAFGLLKIQGETALALLGSAPRRARFRSCFSVALVVANPRSPARRTHACALWIWTMKNKTFNAEQIWKQFEDLLVPRLRLSVFERATYSLLFRHTRLEGRRRFCFSISWLARALRLNMTTARRALRSLAGKGALHIVARTYRGHVVELFLPHQIRVARLPAFANPALDLETLDFSAKKHLRNAIHRREGGRCFYCLRDIPRPQLCLDHVVPEVSHGAGSYRNLVSCCLNCNVRKSGMPAPDYLRHLYRMRRLSASELAERLRALDALASGKLPPPLATAANPLPRPDGIGARTGRPRLHPANPHRPTH
jgi:hypothetical protein